MHWWLNTPSNEVWEMLKLSVENDWLFSCCNKKTRCYSITLKINTLAVTVLSIMGKTESQIVLGSFALWSTAIVRTLSTFVLFQQQLEMFTFIFMMTYNDIWMLFSIDALKFTSASTSSLFFKFVKRVNAHLTRSDPAIVMPLSGDDLVQSRSFEIFSYSRVKR